MLVRVSRRKAHHDCDRRYFVYRDSIPERGEVTAICRDTENWTEEDFDRDARCVYENALAEGADEVFVNGDFFIPEPRPLEALFKNLMLADPAVG